MAAERSKKKAVRKVSTISMDKKRYQKMETALKVIRTWARYAMEHQTWHLPVEHEVLIETIDKALKQE